MGPEGIKRGVKPMGSSPTLPSQSIETLLTPFCAIFSRGPFVILSFMVQQQPSGVVYWECGRNSPSHWDTNCPPVGVTLTECLPGDRPQEAHCYPCLVEK